MEGEETKRNETEKGDGGGNVTLLETGVSRERGRPLACSVWFGCVATESRPEHEELLGQWPRGGELRLKA